ncbi:MAG: hypothetical protein WDO69_33265 [Pseudomonadota bacterium]
MQAALAASARAEANLSGLFRAIQQLGNGVGGAREANESLTLELEGLRDLLGAASERQQIFERKIAELELVLDRTRKEHAQERVFLIGQQDLFLVKLLDEQELVLKQRDSDLETLRGRLAELERRDQIALAPTLVQPSTPPAAVAQLELERSVSSGLDRAERAELERTAQKLAEDRERARETVARLQAQRDEAQSAVARISQERDDALYEIHRLKSELGGPRLPLSTRPPTSEIRRDSSAGRAQALSQLGLEARLGRPTAPPSSPISNTVIESLESPMISSILNPPPGNPHASPIPSRLSPPPSRLSSPLPSPPASQPPEELRRALTSSASSQPTDNRSPLKQKPDASTRPLIGYSLGTGSIEPERLEGAAQLSNPPPGSAKR